MTLFLVALVCLSVFSVMLFISSCFILKLFAEARASSKVIQGLEQELFRLDALLRFLKEAQEMQDLLELLNDLESMEASDRGYSSIGEEEQV